MDIIKKNRGKWIQLDYHTLSTIALFRLSTHCFLDSNSSSYICPFRVKMSHHLQLSIYRALTSCQMHTNKVVHMTFSLFCKTYIGVCTVYFIVLQKLFVISTERRSFNHLFFHCLVYDLLFLFFGILSTIRCSFKTFLTVLWHSTFWDNLYTSFIVLLGS